MYYHSEHRSLLQLDLLMPSFPHLPMRRAFIDGLIPVAICSAASLCPICKEEHTKEHLPTLPRPCGHIFGRPCKLKWFDEGADTCPLDRTKLFNKITVEKDGTRPLLPNLPNSDQQDDPGSSNGTRDEIVRVYTSPTHYLYFGGETLGVNGRLTPEGCRRVVRDLWYHSGLLFSRITEHPDHLDPFSVREHLVNSCVLDALPRGIHIPQEAWVLLARTVRIMLSYYALALAEASEVRMPAEHVRSWEGDLWVICGNGDADV